MDYEARWPSLGQSISSTQQSILPDVYQRTEYEETATAEMPSQYGMTNKIPFNPEVPDFLFPDMPHIHENEPIIKHFKFSSEASNIFRNRNSQQSDASNPEHPAATRSYEADRSVLPSFQQTFGQRNALMNRMFQHPTPSSQIECSGIFRTNEVSSHFPSTYNNFGRSEHILTDEISQYSGMPLETPI
ncbi:hypothetical protein CEXT_182071 [Caerostris extrusa]|uniref:Uncharacterized protein n=1 Tax=Caerostris extrusa TaxID=172846 RepID=A0AAV4Y505_CAEEX|nr:hypothetical protein CEXT_182071 [Caerostris extrusa]